jgi:2,5-dioxopentanoate dehydrogenase
MDLIGKSLIGSRDASGSGDSFRGWNPGTGEKLEPAFYSATKEDIDHATQLATEAFASYSRLRPAARAAFLKRIASGLETIAGQVIERANLENPQPKGRK